VWRANEDGSDGRVFTAIGDWLPDPDFIVNDIAEHDVRNGYDPYGAYVAAQAERERKIDVDLEDRLMASADRIHFELKDEFTAHAPASRPLFLGSGS
jgi:hypothetical protein